MDLSRRSNFAPLADILTSFAEERPTTPARTADPMPEKLGQLGATSRQRAIVARVWSMRADAFALAEAGRLPVFDAKSGKMRAQRLLWAPAAPARLGH